MTRKPHLYQAPRCEYCGVKTAVTVRGVSLCARCDVLTRRLGYSAATIRSAVEIMTGRAKTTGRTENASLRTPRN